nr:hypothetical protein [Bacillus cereus]
MLSPNETASVTLDIIERTVSLIFFSTSIRVRIAIMLSIRVGTPISYSSFRPATGAPTTKSCWSETAANANE